MINQNLRFSKKGRERERKYRITAADLIATALFRVPSSTAPTFTPARFFPSMVSNGKPEAFI